MRSTRCSVGSSHAASVPKKHRAKCHLATPIIETTPLAGKPEWAKRFDASLTIRAPLENVHSDAEMSSRTACALARVDPKVN